MTRIPNWSEDEFVTLLRHNGHSNSELADLLPGRTAKAIEIVRSGIHSYHEGKNISMLSKTMCRYIEDRKGIIRCPKCGAMT